MKQYAFGYYYHKEVEGGGYSFSQSYSHCYVGAVYLKAMPTGSKGNAST